MLTFAQVSLSETVRLNTGAPGLGVRVHGEVAKPLELEPFARAGAGEAWLDLGVGDDLQRIGVQGREKVMLPRRGAPT